MNTSRQISSISDTSSFGFPSLTAIQLLRVDVFKPRILLALVVKRSIRHYQHSPDLLEFGAHSHSLGRESNFLFGEVAFPRELTPFRVAEIAPNLPLQNGSVFGRSLSEK